MEQKDYKNLFQALMPSGPAWTREPRSDMSHMADAFADFDFFIHQRMEKAGLEIFPETCSETLIDHEKMHGLPEICEHGGHSSSQTFYERINNVIAKINRNFSPTTENFAKLASMLGYKVAINTAPPSICGLTRCGDNLGGSVSSNYYWITIVDGARLNYARCGTTVCGEVLCHITWAEDLECLFNRIKPAHTLLKLSYISTEE